ncbi:MAG: hypothetical protein M4579_002124 [Chaenotheca gracillima]|nr:MAG: hypothetical protein M4579_002124 [Chaenotheca gracillima]
MASLQYERVGQHDDDGKRESSNGSDDRRRTPEATNSSGTPSATTRLTPQTDSDENEEPDSDQDFGFGASDDDVDIEKTFRLKRLSKGSRRQPRGRKRGEDSEDSEGDSSDNDEEKYFRGGGPRRRGSESTTHSFMLYTPDEERAVVKRFDRRVVSLVALLYMLSFLDRSNIGNARVAGLTVDLHLTSSQYEWLLTSFYITYILFEWMTILYRLIPPHIYISICVLSWGVLASLQSVSTSFWSLILLRALLGVGEAAFGPGVPFYLSFFYKREELALRTGLFISAAPLATSFAGSLAYFITKHSGGPIAPWRLLFLIEGIPSVFVAVFAWSLIPDGPGKAKFLTRRQKKVAKLRLRKERRSGLDHGHKRVIWREIVQTLADPKCYLTALMFLSCNVAFSSLPVFLPTVIRQMGHSPSSSQALTAPPYLVAFLAVLLTAYLSDRLRDRSSFICFHALLGAAGYLLIAISGQLHWGTTWQYVGVYPAAIGFFSAITIIITWTINNQESDSKKGTGVAILNIIGQCGPLVGTHLYPDRDAPLYTKGMTVCAGFMLFVFFLSLSLRLFLRRKNRRMDLDAAADEANTTSISLRVKRDGRFRFIL